MTSDEPAPSRDACATAPLFSVVVAALNSFLTGEPEKEVVERAAEGVVAEEAEAVAVAVAEET